MCSKCFCFGLSLFSRSIPSFRRFGASATSSDDYFGSIMPGKDAPRPGEEAYDYMNKVGLKGQLRDTTYLKECFLPRDCVQERIYIVAATHPNSRTDLVIDDDTILESKEEGCLGLDSLDMVFE